MTTSSTSLASNGARDRADEWLASPAVESMPVADIDERIGRCVPPGWRRALPIRSWRPGSLDDAF